MNLKLGLLIATTGVLFTLTGCMGHHMGGMSGMDGMSTAEHSKHMKMMNKKGYDRSVARYQIPDLSLTDQNGQRVSLKELLQTDKPVIVNFIYATCTTICPLLSMGYIDLQRELGAKSDDVLLVSITIDPEHDTPEVLNAYRKRYRGKSDWVLLTGGRLDIDMALTAFDAYIGDKMDHQPLNFIRLPERDMWVRLNGMVNGKDFIHELQLAGVWPAK